MIPASFTGLAMPRPRWAVLRVAAFAVAVLFAGFVTVFIADGGRPGAPLLRDAVANSLAIITVALPITLLARRVPIRLGYRWWFVPLHTVAAVATAQLWFVALAMYLAAGVVLLGGRWEPVWLIGPARHWLQFTAVFLYAAVMGACYAVQALRDARTAMALRHEAEVSALRAQLNPHLLFNTLHALLELVRSGDPRADDALDRFARVVRHVAGATGATPEPDLVALRDEWSLVEDYLALEQIRLGPRLRCTLILDSDAAGLHVPALTLQPLVENAIVHGVAPSAGIGQVRVHASAVERMLVIVVEDDGRHAHTLETTDMMGDALRRRSGRGLALVRRRLELQYGKTLAFAAGPRADGPGWRVTVRIPQTPGHARGLRITAEGASV